MRILMVYQKPSMPSSRIRIVQLAPHLEALGIAVTLCPYEEFKPKHLHAYHAVVLQKKTLSWWPSLAWRRLPCPIVYDFDDAIFFRDRHKSGSYESRTRRRRFDRMMRLSSGVVCGNRYLAGFCPPGKPLLIAPSPVPHEVAQKHYAEPAEPVRLGWVGGSGNLLLLDTITEALVALHRETPIELHVLSDRDYVCQAALPVVNQRWSLQTQEPFLASLDLGLMPLIDTPWSRGKCSYKLLQYMAAGVVAIGSNVGMNREVIRHGENGLLADDKNWLAVLREILAERERLPRIGRAGRDTVLQGFTYQQIARQWATFLEEVITSTRAI